MNRAPSFLFGMITGAGLLYAAMSYHFVRSSEGLLMVPKIAKGLPDTYVDIREFGLPQWQEHRALAAALVNSDRSELISGSSLSHFRESIDNLLDGLFGAENR